MRKLIKIIVWVLLAIVLLAAVAWFGFLKPEAPPISAEDRAAIQLMPLPAEMKLARAEFLLEKGLSCQFSLHSSPRLDRALERFYNKLSRQTGMDISQGQHKNLILECKGNEKEYPSLGDDESYSISVSAKKIDIKAAGETGIIYALESLLQLAVEKEGRWIIPALSMNDQARYPWRGLMIDVCRHWMPKELILRNLEAMGALKMNVFHWHLTESQAFRIESKLYPRLHEMGSWGEYYTQDDIREVIEFAADRGIRVVPEFDVPGHSTAWFVGHPELASAPGPYELDTAMMGIQAAMDPTREDVYEFLNDFLGEMAALFPDEYLHIGGDEVVPTQWNENRDIQKYMEKHGLEDNHALQAHFNIRLQKIVAAHGKIMTGWDEIMHPDLPREGIAVQSWRDHGSLWESARQGNKAILSAGYYLDHKQTAAYHYAVDPTVIPGAVDIVIDSLNWKSWECTMSISEMRLDGAIYLFGEGDSLRGIMEFMGSAMGFTEATVDNNQLSFIVKGPMGDLAFEIDVDGDSITGSSKISVFNLLIKGQRSGGSDMEEGAPLPEFKKIEALSPEQESNLIGGEACMWSEQVDDLTIESRIWPRAAVIAEKLWSPKVLTDDVNDMYRRLMLMDGFLEQLGLRHLSYRDILIDGMVSDPYLEPLKILAEVLQEDKMFARLAIYKPTFYTTTPLNRMVDVARPESYVAYRFSQDVGLWTETRDEGVRERLVNTLEIWSANHEKLTPAFDGNDRLLEVMAHSEHLSQLADVALTALSEPTSLKEKEDELTKLFSLASKSYGATNLPITQDVQKLLESATKN